MVKDYVWVLCYGWGSQMDSWRRGPRCEAAGRDSELCSTKHHTFMLVLGHSRRGTIGTHWAIAALCRFWSGVNIPIRAQPSGEGGRPQEAIVVSVRLQEDPHCRLPCCGKSCLDPKGRYGEAGEESLL